jgi:hypothetical protein
LTVENSFKTYSLSAAIRKKISRLGSITRTIKQNQLKTLMKKLFICTLACSLAFSSFAAKGGSSATTFSNDEQMVVNEQDYSTCAEEIIDFTGTCYVRTSGTINANKISYKLHLNYQELKGIGETTGAAYQGNIVENDIINEDFDGAYDKTHVITGAITTAGGVNRLVHINVRTQVDVYGQVTTTVSNITDACQ